MAVAPDLTSLNRVTDAVEGAEPLGSVRLGDMARSLAQAALKSRGSGKRAADFARESALIALGRSAIEPTKGDWRFRDPTWSDNALYRRLMQLYLAWVDAMEELVESTEMEWRDSERARFFMSILTSAAAPTNTLPGNPAALKRAFETGGLSMARGMRNLVRDIRHNGGMPLQVDRRSFQVGEDLAATPGSVVYRDEVCEVIQYAPSTPTVVERPVVVIPPQINRYYFLDLAPGRSLVEYVVGRGIPVFMISWRNPGPGQSDWDLDTYASAALRAIDVAREVSRSDQVNALSFCAGGILTATILSHLASQSDERVHTASFGVTLLDFAIPNTIGLLDTSPLIHMARTQASRAGVLDGRRLANVFTWLRPNDLVWNYWVNNNLLGADPPVFDILAWNVDATNLPAKLHTQLLRIFTDNLVATPGGVEVLGTPVNVAAVKVETYVTGALTDHLTPWKGCYRTTQLLGGPSTFILSNAGHIASLVNPPGNPKAHYFVGPEPVPDPDLWRAAAERRSGTWWEHWADWVTARSGDERKAPARPGSRRHPAIEPAPGAYVRGLEPAVA
jgi:poly[(R)-3-hydroxyalkanoate] polymerase subunit PhaC